MVDASFTDGTSSCIMSLTANDRSRKARQLRDLCGAAAVGDTLSSSGGSSLMSSHNTIRHWTRRSFPFPPPPPQTAPSLPAASRMRGGPIHGRLHFLACPWPSRLDQAPLRRIFKQEVRRGVVCGEAVRAHASHKVLLGENTLFRCWNGKLALLKRPIRRGFLHPLQLQTSPLVPNPRALLGPVRDLFPRFQYRRENSWVLRFVRCRKRPQAVGGRR